MNEKEVFSIDDLSNITGLKKRNIRYYIQKGIIDNPVGRGKGAYYTNNHLKQLKETLKWKDAGLSLERIQDIVKGLVSGNKKHIPKIPKYFVSDIEVWSRLTIDNGIEMNINTALSGVNQDECRQIQKKVMKVINDFKNEKIKKG